MLNDIKILFYAIVLFILGLFVDLGEFDEQ